VWLVDYLADVEPAVDEFIDALDAEQERTRTNACRALGYVGDRRALKPLKTCRREDSSVVVQKMAGWALGQFSNTP
jgi:HEAT repeat protein